MNRITDPLLLKANVEKEQAMEIMYYLYGEFLDGEPIEFTHECYGNSCLMWTCDGISIAKWTEEYKNVMISESFIENLI